MPRISVNSLMTFCLAAVIGLGFADHATGTELGLALFYLIPVLACAYFCTTAAAGLVVAGAAALAWFWADVSAREDPRVWLSVWNATTRFAIFTMAVIVTASLRDGRERLKQLNGELQLLLEGERELARTDPLTGLPNTRAFLEHLEVELARAQRTDKPLCVAYLDLDDFKQVNDRGGHATGDAVLEKVGEVLREVTRAGDVPARLAGDEFAVLLSEVTPSSAEQVAQRIIDEVSAIHIDGQPARVGASVGIAYFASSPVDARTAIGLADGAMYQAKAQGRGCIVVKSVDGEALAGGDCLRRKQ